MFTSLKTSVWGGQGFWGLFTDVLYQQCLVHNRCICRMDEVTAWSGRLLILLSLKTWYTWNVSEDEWESNGRVGVNSCLYLVIKGAPYTPPWVLGAPQAAVQNLILQDLTHLCPRAGQSSRSWDSELEMSVSSSGEGWSGAVEPGLSACGHWVATLPRLIAISRLSRHPNSWGLLGVERLGNGSSWKDCGRWIF